jgi:hypothetical protein
MVPLFALPLVALGAFLIAVAAARWRGRRIQECQADVGIAVAAATASILVAVAAFAIGQRADAFAWRNLGGLALLSAPLVCAAALKRRRRRALARSLAGGLFSWLLAAAWLVLYLKGPGGGWRAAEIATAALAGALAIAFGACAAAWTEAPGRTVRASSQRTSTLTLLALWLLLSGCSPEEGVLALRLVDRSTGEETSARVELIDAGGQAVVADGALPILDDCGMLPAHNWLPAAASAQGFVRRKRSLLDPYRQVEQFYVDGHLKSPLAAGRYRLRATKGPEYHVSTQDLVIPKGGTGRATVELSRWIDLPGEGWYGADDHLHIPRPSARFDEPIAIWMQAEDLHVANLLQMGFARDLHITPQHGFGEPSVYRRDRTLVVSGQENPRSHVLGHSIILGARRWIDFPADYLVYSRFWEAAHREGGINGYAHFALAGAEKGLALWADSGHLDFIEVQNFGFPIYARWYEALNLGLRITPTAGTDFPCVPNLPGRDRFYTRVEGPWSFEAWLEGVRRGRTFVTNGPAIDLKVEAVGPGGELTLADPAAVRIEGRVRFDPESDRVERLELIEAGEVVLTIPGDGRSGEIRLRTTRAAARTTWFAVRAWGAKLDETRPPSLSDLESALAYPPSREPPGDDARIPGDGPSPVSAAHSAPVYVTVLGTPELAEQPAAREVARAWLARLDDLEWWLSDGMVDQLAGFPGRGDGIPKQDFLAQRDRLRQAIAQTRERLRRRVGISQGGAPAQPGHSGSTP